METVLIMLCWVASNVACFLIGAKVFEAAAKSKEIKLPTVNPVQIVREHRAKQEAEMEQGRLETIMQNIENYDGTGHKQEDVPKR